MGCLFSRHKTPGNSNDNSNDKNNDKSKDNSTDNSKINSNDNSNDNCSDNSEHSYNNSITDVSPELDQSEDSELEQTCESSPPVYSQLVRRKSEVILPTHDKASRPDYKVAVAFDFGTTFSGYAYSYKNKPNEIYLNETWGQSVGCTSWKSPTTVCFKSDDTFDSFGYEAHANYLQSVTNELQLYQKFKLQLHNQRKKIYASEGVQITSDHGKTLPGIQVFSEALNYLKEHFMKVVTKADRIRNINEVLWVLTVPAIWSEEEKMFMKECAVKAGMIDSCSSDRLIIALEPEAASFDCRSGSGKLTAGQSYMVIDAGGGTVDITVHEIQTDGSSKEKHPPSGGIWGGDMVNRQFVKLLKKVLGVDFLNHCKQETPQIYFDLMQDFETKKTSIKDFTRPINLKLSMNLAECYKEKTMKNLADALADTKSKGIWIPNSKSGILVGPENLKQCFDPTVEEIVSKVQELLKVPQILNVDKIFLVGGFGSCNYLQSALKRKFSNIYIPEEPSLSVLKGAVLYAHHPGFISSRISTKTYAFMTYRDIPKNNVDEMRVVGKNAYSYLQPIIKKGESVEINTIKQQTAFPEEHHMTSVEMDLYSTSGEFNENPFGKGMEKVARVKVNVPKNIEDRTITFQFIFGGTELRVKGTNSRGESEETNLSYIQS